MNSKTHKNDEYQTVKILRSTITALKKTVEDAHISVRSDAEAVNLAINSFILAHQAPESNKEVKA